jgi:hypothetical protein
MQTEASEARDLVKSPPLTLPPELWVTLSRDHQAACVSAEGLLRAFDEDKSSLLKNLLVATPLSVEQTLAGLRVLEGMDLVTIEATDQGPLVTLVALPEEHVRIVGPDGNVRWLLVARPLEAPEVEPANLN